MLNRVREKIGLLWLNKKVDGTSRKRKVVNLDNARYVGLLYDGTDEGEHRTVMGLIKKLQESKKSVKALGVIFDKHSPNHCNPTLYNEYYTFKEVDFWFKPSNYYIDDFIKNEFDVLIDLNLKWHLSCQYIIGLSKARFKVGRENTKPVYYDLMLNVKNNTGFSEYLNQTVNYLTMINKT